MASSLMAAAVVGRRLRAQANVETQEFERLWQTRLLCHVYSTSIACQTEDRFMQSLDKEQPTVAQRAKRLIWHKAKQTKKRTSMNHVCRCQRHITP